MIRPMTDEERQRAKERAMANKERSSAATDWQSQSDEGARMSDDLVKQSLAELHDIVRCRCHPAYTGRGMHDPDCECDSVEAVKAVADRIEELEAKLRESALQELSALGQASEAYQAQLAAEAKLQDQTHLIEQLFALLDKTEETDDGRFFHPTTIRSCRASDTEKLNRVLVGLKHTLEDWG